MALPRILKFSLDKLPCLFFSAMKPTDILLVAKFKPRPSQNVLKNNDNVKLFFFLNFYLLLY